jgi:hypothetical protein
MISPKYEEYLTMRCYLVVRTNGTIHFKHGVNKFYTKKFARMSAERTITWKEFQQYYQSILNMIANTQPQMNYEYE